jgi:hypothetical protein
MRFFTARFLALAALVPALFLVVVVPGCAKQSEGERCGDSISASNSDDCGDGLTCTPADTLLNSNGAHRCCYSDRVTDSRCEPKGAGPVPTAGAGGGGSGGETSGGSGSGGETSSGGIAGSGVAGGSTEQAGAAGGS